VRVLVVGYGSIGQRHTEILLELKCEVSVVSQRRIDFPQVYGSCSEAIEKETFDYVVIANKTSEHYETLVELVKYCFKGIVLVEKPLFKSNQIIPINSFLGGFVAYNLRFHPLVQKLKQVLASEPVLSVQVYVGQYLPFWRPERDYRLSYSALKIEGGGVLRDLSHELDYINWILDGWSEVVATGGHWSHLDIDSDDIFSLLMKTKKCRAVSIQMNYLDRVNHREILVNTEDHFYKVDFIQNTFQKDRDISSFPKDSNYTYRAQHQALINGHFDQLCSFDSGLAIVRLIEASEQSVKETLWKKSNENL